MEFNDNFDFVDEFERKLCEYTGFKYAVCTDCCTNALLISLVCRERLGMLNRNTAITIPSRTYLSVPMMLCNNGFNIKFKSDCKWSGMYQLGDTNIWDAAADMNENMRNSFWIDADSMVCISFQQKKRLPLGRGGAVLTDNQNYVEVLKRLRYDGRNPKISDRTEIQESPEDITLGYHCYMEPDKAVKGILALNQPAMLRPYVCPESYMYESLDKIGIFR